MVLCLIDYVQNWSLKVLFFFPNLARQCQWLVAPTMTYYSSCKKSNKSLFVQKKKKLQKHPRKCRTKKFAFIILLLWQSKTPIKTSVRTKYYYIFIIIFKDVAHGSKIIPLTILGVRSSLVLAHLYIFQLRSKSSIKQPSYGDLFFFFTSDCVSSWLMCHYYKKIIICVFAYQFWVIPSTGSLR